MKQTFTLVIIITLLLMYTNTLSAQSEVVDSDQTTADHTSYVILPSAFGPDKSQLILENIALGYFSGEYGLANNLSFKGSFELFNPLFASEAPTLTLQPKVHGSVTDYVSLAAELIHVIGFGDGSITVPHGLATIGSRTDNFSLGYGRVFYNYFGVDDQYNAASISGKLKLNDVWSVVTDNWLLLNVPDDTFANVFNFYSVGLSKKMKKSFQLDFGLTYFSEEEDLGKFPWPYFKFRANASNAKSLFSKNTNRVKKVKEPIEIEKKEKLQKGIYGEFLGLGILYSVNFDVRLSSTQKGDGLGLRVGFSAFGPLVVPLQINYLAGGPRHFLELGSGVTLANQNFDVSNGTYGSFNVSPSSSLGYRFQALNSGFFFKIGADYFYTFDISDDGATIWPTVGFGYSFR